jgi:hypothetical protein
MVDTLLNVDAIDVGRLALPPPKLKNEARRGLGERPTGLTKETVEMGRTATVGEGGRAGTLPAPGDMKKGRVMVPLAR